MNQWTFFFALFALVISPNAIAAEPKKNARETIESLIQGLGSDEFKEREQATRLLWVKGEEGMAALEKASRSEDPEISMRAGMVLEKVELRITPETDPEVLEQIEAYRKAPLNLKPNHLNNLRQKKAFFQMLKLFSTETNDEAEAAMRPMMRGVAILSARAAIVSGKLPEALKLLEMSAKEPTDLIALACVYRSMGKLKNPANLPPAPAGVSEQEWRIALLRVRGDVKAAKEIASGAKLALVHSGLSALSGDPLPWLRMNSDDALGQYVKLTQRRWSGESLKAHDYAPLIETMQDLDSNDRIQARASLLALGRPEKVEKTMMEEQPLAAFLHFLNQERIDDALKAVGLDSEKPDYRKWVEERFHKLEVGNDHRDESSPQDELRAMAHFLESRGLRNELAAAFSPSLEALEKRDQELFSSILRELFSGMSAPMFALDFGAKWAGEDEQRWDDVSAAAFGAEEQANEWIEWIETIEPGFTRLDMMRLLMALFKLGTDDSGLAEKWQAKVWEIIENSEPRAKEEHLKKMINLAVIRQDVIAALRARDSLDKQVQKTVIWPGIEHYYTAAGRWKDAVELIDKPDSEVSASPETHAYLAAILRRAGFAKRAAEHDAWAEKLALGHSPTCALIGDYYTYGGDYKRAAKWYLEAALLADMSNEFFFRGLEKVAQNRFENGDWLVAASCYEVLVYHSVSDGSGENAADAGAKNRMKADLAKACAIFATNRPLSLHMLSEIHRNFATDGLLADDFFPILKKLGLKAELEKYFELSWAKVSESIERFPGTDNARNTAAWLAGRAGLRLKEAENYLRVAIGRNPGQPAYLDTMAELHFARGDRQGALKYSRESLQFYPQILAPYDLVIRKQNERFTNAPLPR